MVPFQYAADQPLIRQAAAGNGKTVNIIRGQQSLTGNLSGRCFHNAGPCDVVLSPGRIIRRNREPHLIAPGRGGDTRQAFAQRLVGAFFSRPESPENGIAIFRPLFDKRPLFRCENPVQKAPVPGLLPVVRQIQIDNIVPDAGQNSLPPFAAVSR